MSYSTQTPQSSYSWMAFQLTSPPIVLPVLGFAALSGVSSLGIATPALAVVFPQAAIVFGVNYAVNFMLDKVFPGPKGNSSVPAQEMYIILTRVLD